MWSPFVGMFKYYFRCTHTPDIFDDNAMIQIIIDMMIEDYYRFFFEIFWFCLAYYSYTIDSCKIYEDQKIIVFVIEISLESFDIFYKTK